MSSHAALLCSNWTSLHPFRSPRQSSYRIPSGVSPRRCLHDRDVKPRHSYRIVTWGAISHHGTGSAKTAGKVGTRRESTDKEIKETKIGSEITWFSKFVPGLLQHGVQSNSVAPRFLDGMPERIVTFCLANVKFHILFSQGQIYILIREGYILLWFRNAGGRFGSQLGYPRSD